MFSNKKSSISGRKIIFYLIAVIVTSITFMVLLAVIAPYKAEIAIIPENIENYLLEQRFFSSDSCFTYKYSGTERVYPNVIDLSKFNQENLDKCYDAVTTEVRAYSLALEYGGQTTTLNTRNWIGGPDKIEKFQVFVYDPNTLTTLGANLFIGTQNAK